MRIGYLVHDINPKAGWGRLGSDLISGVKKTGHEVTILKEIDDGFIGIPILKRGGGVFLSAFHARKHLKNCDVIHALDVYPYGIIAFLATLFLRKNIVISLVGTYSVAPLYNWKTSLLSSLSLRAATVTSISEFTKREVLKKVHLRDVVIITPGIDLGVFRKEHGESKEQFIISVGALKERKGYHVSIPAFALAKKEIPGLKYKIVGSQRDSSYFSELKRLAREYGVEDTVQFLTNVSDDDLSDLYKEARLFLLSSVNAGHHFEGFGIVFLEAAAAGLPVVGTWGNGIEDAIRDNQNGFLVAQNDIAETSKAIIKIVGNSEKWHEMSAHSYSWADENSLDSMVKKYTGIYKKISNHE
ncbi:MAG: glycosyltransferase family 4 protein [Minisyncoccota bacterium]